MGMISRTIRSSPERTSVETWSKISEIVCGQDSEALKEFDKVSDYASSLIPEEFMKDHPMIIKGAGSQLRIYCLYGEDAVTGDDANEESLSWEITSKEWKVFLPCSKEELGWYEKALAGLSNKFKVYNLEDGLDKEEYQASKNTQKIEFNINEEAYRKL